MGRHEPIAREQITRLVSLPHPRSVLQRIGRDSPKSAALSTELRARRPCSATTHDAPLSRRVVGTPLPRHMIRRVQQPHHGGLRAMSTATTVTATVPYSDRGVNTDGGAADLAIAELCVSYERSLRADGRLPRTVEACLATLVRFSAFPQSGHAARRARDPSRTHRGMTIASDRHPTHCPGIAFAHRNLGPYFTMPANTSVRAARPPWRP